jgi:hypothetical protein
VSGALVHADSDGSTEEQPGVVGALVHVDNDGVGVVVDGVDVEVPANKALIVTFEPLGTFVPPTL